MIRETLFPLACGVTFAVMASASAGESTSPNAGGVTAFVKKAVTHLDLVGAEKAFADFSDTNGEWVKGELYILCHTLDGINVAHGGNPALIGRNVIGFKDPNGVPINVLILEKMRVEGKGWIEYKWPNPATRKVDARAVYFEKAGSRYACGSGYYK